MTPSTLALNAVQVQKSWLEETTQFHEGEIVRIESPAHNLDEEAILFCTGAPLPEKNNCRLTVSLYERLELGSDNEIFIKPIEKQQMSVILPQRIDVIKTGEITVSPRVHAWLMREPHFAWYRIHNQETNMIHVAHRDSFIADKGLSDTEMKLNHCQRKLLGINADAKKDGWRHRANLCVIPLVQSSNVSLVAYQKNNRWLSRKVGDFFIGSASLTLQSIRPYVFDEDADIVRISRTSAGLLGIEETDLVTISYGDYSTRARAFFFENFDDDRERTKATLTQNATLQDGLQGIAVGIPVRLRRELGLPTIKHTVIVSRDTGFLLRKHINSQILPLAAFFLALITTVGVFVELEVLAVGIKTAVGALLVSLWLLVIAIFVLFSGLRSRVK
ncbi:MAG: hypothetical protein FWG78_04815 [Coriobacteriia bacterium]|nr:hypothetical protein [Coriobacteriia bacterium]